MDSNRLPWFAIWTRIVCDAVLIIGGTLLAYGALLLGPNYNRWFIAYGVLAGAVALLTACSRKRRTRRYLAFLQIAILLDVAAMTLFIAIMGKLDSSVLFAIGALTAWPTLSLLGLFLDREASKRIDRFTSLNQAEATHRLRWWEPIKRLGYSGVILCYVPACLLYCATLIPTLFTQIESRSWSQTPGTVVLSDVRRDGESSLFLGEHNLLYNYQVEGKTYRGTRPNGLHPQLVEKWQANRLAEQYPVGSSTTVYYRPDDPSQSLLEPGLNAQILLFLLGISLPLSIAASMCFLAFDQELRFLLPAARYEQYSISMLNVIGLSLCLSGVIAGVIASGCLAMTNQAPTSIDAWSAWTVAIGIGWLHFRWVHRMVIRDRAEKSQAQGFHAGNLNNALA